MSRAGFKSGFSIVELITVLAIALLLGSILLGVGTQIKSQANDRLAESTIDILVCALEQYYTARTEFPFEADEDYIQADFASSINASVDIINGTLSDEDWSSGALYYFLHQIPNSRSIISAINDSLKTTKGSTGTVMELDLDGDGTKDNNFMRFVDPWGRSFRYTYTTGQTFPKIVSAGSDGVFDNGDDIRSRR